MSLDPHTPPVPGAGPASPQAGAPAATVLVVDDNPSTRYATARVLRAAGFATREAATGAQALALADDGVSAVVLDVHLPDLDGFEVCRRLRARETSVRLPVVHLSAAYVTDVDKVRGLDVGADAYLTHPAEPAVLVATVRALIRARTAEIAMRRSEARFRAIYDQALGGICVLDAGLCVADANPALLQLLGRPADQVIGQPLRRFAPPAAQSALQALADLPAEQGWRGELLLVDATGALLHLDCSVSAELEHGRRVATVANLSERIALEQRRERLLEREQAARAAAERLARMKDEFIAVLSHELRTPLNAITGWTHVLKKRGGTPELLRGLETIERNAKVQARLISDILDVSRINMGKLRLEREAVDPVEVTASAIAALQSAADDKGVRLLSTLPPAAAPMWLDAARFQQVVWNLLTNALKFSTRGDQVQVRLQRDADGLLLAVEDQGRGIDPAFLPHIFERFTQAESATRRVQGGLGLGLSIVKHLVELHGGSVQAHSEGVGRGARFEVRLPDAAPAPAVGEAAPDTAYDTLPPADLAGEPLAGLDLLVVDDDAETLSMLTLLLGDEGARVRTAGDVDAAWQALRERRPDVLVCDVGLPGKDGYDLLRELRHDEAERGLPRLPAIALTAFTRAEDRELALAAGFDVHCPKPLKPRRLIEAVSELAVRPGSR